jgi:hypothetical protein
MALKGFSTNTRLTSHLWFRLMMSYYQQVALWVVSGLTRVWDYVCATMSVGLWCACLEHRDDGRKLRWRSCALVLMDRERWRASARSWLTNQSNQVASHGGWHLGHTLTRGRGGVDRVTNVVEDWRDTRLVTPWTWGYKISSPISTKFRGYSFSHLYRFPLFSF